MDFNTQIRQLGERVAKLKDQIHTEEATKNAFIMPLLQCLGYDVFDPMEVVPEFVTDIGIKKGEKIDYAIFKDGSPTILVECKHWAQNLNLHNGQLLRYFHVSPARFGVLTNGINYKFYSDLVEPNKMDEKPFLEFNIDEIKDNQLDELKKFHKTFFDAETIINTAGELKFMNELKQVIQQDFTNPTHDFVKYLTKQVYTGVVSTKVLERFTGLAKKSIQQHINDVISDRLKTALNDTDEELTPSEKVQIPEVSKIFTTEEELEAFMIVKAILRQQVDVSRISYKDAQSYFSIVLDGSTRKTICRLYLNGNKKYIVTFDENRKEVKNEITSLDDIFSYSNILLNAVDTYEDKKQLVEQ